MKVVLIGYRAAGKSTVGKLLAAKMNVPFWDADLLLEERLGMPIKEIVASHGWNYFRAREKEIIQKLAQKGSGVIATGGGVVLAQDNIDLLKENGFVVWLNAPLHEIIGRLQEDAHNGALRPQFTAGNLASETTDVWKQRFPLYEKAADISLATAGKSALQVADEIYQYLLQSDAWAQSGKNGKEIGSRQSATGD